MLIIRRFCGRQLHANDVDTASTVVTSQYQFFIHNRVADLVFSLIGPILNPRIPVRNHYKICLDKLFIYP